MKFQVKTQETRVTTLGTMDKIRQFVLHYNPDTMDILDIMDDAKTIATAYGVPWYDVEETSGHQEIWFQWEAKNEQ